MSKNWEGWVRPVWRWTLWWTHCATIRKSGGLKGLIDWSSLRSIQPFPFGRQHFSSVCWWSLSFGRYHRHSCQWPRVPERIKFKLVIFVYRALHGTAPRYLADTPSPVAALVYIPSNRLQSSNSSRLDVRSARPLLVKTRNNAWTNQLLRTRSVLNNRENKMTIHERMNGHRTTFITVDWVGEKGTCQWWSSRASAVTLSVSKSPSYRHFYNTGRFVQKFPHVAEI